MKFYINLINILFVFLRFCLHQKWTKVRTKFFLFDSERASDIMFNRRPPVKMVDFHGEVTIYPFLTALKTFLRHSP
jgi:hypothetical protein